MSDFEVDISPQSGWAHISTAACLAKLESSLKSGLTDEEAELRRRIYGQNVMEEGSASPILLFLSFMWNPMSWAMELAGIVAICLLDYIDFCLILVLLLLNSSLGFWEEKKSRKAVKVLQKQLAPKSLVLRNEQWKEIETSDLVPGDIVRLTLGDVIPADMKLLQGERLTVDQSMLTGESRPVVKEIGDEVYSGSVVKVGEMEGIVYATGEGTFFGKATLVFDAYENSGKLQNILTIIGNTCIVLIIIWIVVELIVQFGARSAPCSLNDDDNCATLKNVLVLVVGGIPVSMPTVLSVTLSIGAIRMAKRDAIVTRLGSFEELASMDILCCDKTGTLTLNELTLEKQLIHPFRNKSSEEIIRMASLTARKVMGDSIDVCLMEECEDRETLWDDFERLKFVPFDPVSKRSVVRVKNTSTGKCIWVAKGAPQVLLHMDSNSEDIEVEFIETVEEYSKLGLRSLAVATCESDVSELSEVTWDIIGLLPLKDPPRHDCNKTIQQAKSLGVDIKMITGDQLSIAFETARQLCIPQEILTTSFFQKIKEMKVVNMDELIENADGFAEVFPEHKTNIVKSLQKRGHVVGMTGDGVNDAPALKAADIGIAVDNASGAARASADIVLLSPGLSVIVEAIDGSRKIFARMKTFAMYSVATAVRMVFTFGLLTVIYNWYFPTLAIVVMAVINDGTIMSICVDRAWVSDYPTSWKLKKIFAVAISLGVYLTISTIVLFEVTYKTSLFTNFGLDSYEVTKDNTIVTSHDCHHFVVYSSMLDNWDLHVSKSVDTDLRKVCTWDNSIDRSYPRNFKVDDTYSGYCLCGNVARKNAAIRGLIYIQVSVTGQWVIFVARARRISYLTRPGLGIIVSFIVSQIAATLIGVYGFGDYPEGRGNFNGCGWGYGLVAWVWSILWIIPMDFIKLTVLYCMSNISKKTYNLTQFHEEFGAGQGRCIRRASVGMAAATSNIGQQRRKSRAMLM
eukprot:Nk52_evm47s208 gene=Nk52_evmTU47s208